MSKSWPCFPLAGQNRDMWVASPVRMLSPADAAIQTSGVPARLPPPILHRRALPCPLISALCGGQRDPHMHAIDIDNAQA